MARAALVSSSGRRRRETGSGAIRDDEAPGSGPERIQLLRNRNALPTTLTDEKLIATAAISGESSSPKAG